MPKQAFMYSKAINTDELHRKRSAKMACKLLSKYFTDRSNKKKQPIVLLLDEVRIRIDPIENLTIF